MWPGKWVARHGLGRGGPWRLGARRGQRLVPLHAIPSPGVWWRPGNWSPWELRRCDPLRGIGLMGYVAKCKRGGVVLCHVFKYRKGRSPTCSPPAGRPPAFLPAVPGTVRPASGPGRSVHTVPFYSSHLSVPASKIPQIPRYDKKNKLEICQPEVDRGLEGEKWRKRRGRT